MVVKLTRKSDDAQVEAMFFDGTQTGAVGISAWAGSEGVTVNMQYRGGDNSDWVLAFPGLDDPEVLALAGDWVVDDGGRFYFIPESVVSEEYDAVPD